MISHFLYCRHNDHLMDRVGVLFKQFLSNCEFCLCDPCDLIPLPLNSDNNVMMIVVMIIMIIVIIMIVICVLLFLIPSPLEWWQQIDAEIGINDLKMVLSSRRNSRVDIMVQYLDHD